jgi:hypothetical protein
MTWQDGEEVARTQGSAFDGLPPQSKQGRPKMSEIQASQPGFPSHRGTELQENQRLNNGLRGAFDLLQRGADVGLGLATGGIVGSAGGLAALGNSLVRVPESGMRSAGLSMPAA